MILLACLRIGGAPPKLIGVIVNTPLFTRALPGDPVPLLLSAHIATGKA